MSITPVTIGNLTLPNPFFLAPMAGVTDRSFRHVCRRLGCGFTYSEMISAQSIVYENAHTRQLLDTFDEEKPWAVQLFGHKPEAFAEAVRRLEGYPFDMVDINMGCPVPKIIRNGEGCALMNDPVLAGRIIEAAVRASNRPVTVKLRKGFSGARVNVVEMARVAQESGAQAVAVHGRTRDQFYAGQADWSCIADVKQAVTLPVIGNGDITAPEDATRMMAETGCDAVMIGRGAMGNPWLFARALHYGATGTVSPPPGAEEKIRIAVVHLHMAVAHKGERIAIPEMRKHLSWYIKGSPSASALRRLINAASTTDEMENILRQAWTE